MSFERELTAEEVDKIFKKRGIANKPGNETLELTDAEVDALLGTDYAKGNHKRPDSTKFNKDGKAVKAAKTVKDVKAVKDTKTSTNSKTRKTNGGSHEIVKTSKTRKSDVETKDRKVRKHRNTKVEPPRPTKPVTKDTKALTRPKPKEEKQHAKPASHKLRELTKESQYHDLLENNERVVLFFGSEGCPACKGLHPLYERIANRYHEKVTLAYADVDKYQINFKYVPVFQIFYRGEKKDEIIGATADELKEFIAQAIKLK